MKKDEWDTKEGTGKYVTIYAQEYGKRHSQAEAPSNSKKKVKPIVLTIVQLH